MYQFPVNGLSQFLFGLFWCWFFSTRKKKDQKKTENNQENASNDIPWLSILKSGPFWALTIAQFSSNYVSYTVQLLSVKFIISYLQYDLKEAGLFASLPNIAKPITCLAVGYVTDKWSLLLIRVKK